MALLMRQGSRRRCGRRVSGDEVPYFPLVESVSTKIVTGQAARGISIRRNSDAM